MIPGAELRHASPGRVRVRIRAMRGDEEYFRAVETGLARQFGAVVADSTTGSVLLQGADVSSAAVGRFATEQGLFELPLDQPQPRTERVAASASQIEDWAPAFALLFSVLAAIQFARGRVMAPAVTLLWYALDALERSQQRG